MKSQTLASDFPNPETPMLASCLSSPLRAALGSVRYSWHTWKRWRWNETHRGFGLRCSTVTPAEIERVKAALAAGDEAACKEAVDQAKSM